MFFLVASKHKQGKTTYEGTGIDGIIVKFRLEHSFLLGTYKDFPSKI